MIEAQILEMERAQLQIGQGYDETAVHKAVLGREDITPRIAWRARMAQWKG